jgi:hypothetical protein
MKFGEGYSSLLDRVLDYRGPRVRPPGFKQTDDPVVKQTFLVTSDFRAAGRETESATKAFGHRNNFPSLRSPNPPQR